MHIVTYLFCIVSRLASILPTCDPVHMSQRLNAVRLRVRSLRPKKELSCPCRVELPSQHFPFGPKVDVFPSRLPIVALKRVVHRRCGSASRTTCFRYMRSRPSLLCHHPSSSSFDFQMKILANAWLIYTIVTNGCATCLS